MEDPRWLRLITIGLVLSALAVGYFLLTGRFTSTKTNKPTPTAQSLTAQPVQKITQASPSPRPTPTASSATTKGGQPIASLPATGFPAGLAVTFSVSAIAAGYGLRKYPN